VSVKTTIPFTNNH